MAFNITSWGRGGRDFSRGEPPPRGSIEYAGVPDMFLAGPPARAAGGPAAVPRGPAPARGRSIAGPALAVLGGAVLLGGISRLLRRPRRTTVAVPDALQDEGE